ncbi:hypothetical protein D9758_015360 [Tetrapyrgos nigripes]|uniref:Uncharacterized protein n=1 Tax=Tetrapyrgos nigripes TaxID=182062 RepID=A0A8H5CL04_9AGAR|nr:hypothetical protein D9758_015360 [Tetrapyrgos nigripes]
MNFFSVKRDELHEGSAADFENIVCSHVLGVKWKENTERLITGANLAKFRDEDFSLMFNTLMAYNKLLDGTSRHMSDSSLLVALRTAIERVPGAGLRDYLEEKKVLDVEAGQDLKKWVEVITIHDAEYRKFKKPERDRLERLEKALRAASYSNQSSSSSSRNTDSSSNSRDQYRSSRAPAPAVGAVFPTNRAPYMSEVRALAGQIDLYKAMHMCFSCRVANADHKGSNCPNKAVTPPLTVPNRPLTQDDVDYVTKIWREHNKPVSLNAILKRRTAPAVAAVGMASGVIDDLDAFLEDVRGRSHPVSAVFPSARNVSDTDLYSNAHVRRRSSSWPSPMHVPGRRGRGSAHYDDYANSPSPDNRRRRYSPSPRRRHRSPSSSPSRASPVAALNHVDDEEDVNWVENDGPTTPRGQKAAAGLRNTVVSEAPLRLPHLNLHAALEGPATSSPLHVSLLLDSGSHIVLIRDDLVVSLGLRRFRLPRPELIGVATTDSSSQSRTIALHEFVKLRITDHSNTWTSRTVQAIIAPSLCSPMILGLPFLSHNNLSINCTDRTCIDSVTGIDILDAKASAACLLSSKPPPDSRSPKQKRIEICKLRIALIRELKSFHDRNPRLRDSDEKA